MGSTPAFWAFVFSPPCPRAGGDRLAPRPAGGFYFYPIPPSPLVLHSPPLRTKDGWRGCCFRLAVAGTATPLACRGEAKRRSQRTLGPKTRDPINHLTITNYQLPVTSYQLPVTNYQLPVTSYQLPITSYQLPVTSYQLPVTSYQLPVTSYQLPVTSYQLPITSYQLPVTSYQLPVTSYQLPVTNYQFPNSLIN